MDKAIVPSNYHAQPSLHFRELRTGENFRTLAERYKVDETAIRAQNPGIAELPGEMVVINLRA